MSSQAMPQLWEQKPPVKCGHQWLDCSAAIGLKEKAGKSPAGFPIT
jgi:hypothetical protein